MSNRTPARSILVASLALVILAAAVPPSPLAAQAKTKAKAPAAKDSDPYAGVSLGAFKLRSIGPALTSGRISDFAVRPGKRHEFFVASASGGVWKTVNAGTTFTPVFDAQGSYSIGCVTLDPNDPNVVWVGTGENNNQRSVGYGDGVYKSEDGGASWRKIDRFPGVPDLTYVNDLVASHHDRNTVYAAFNNHKRGDFKPYVLKSTDLGRTWTPIASDLPARGSVYALAEDHVRPDLLFAGTEFGLFATLDGGRHWKRLSAGLPTIAVRDLAVQKRENDLVLATFGRGFYILDDYSALRGVKPDVLARDGHLFPVKDAWMFVEKQPLGSLGSREKGFQGESYFTVPNPSVAAVFTYHLKDAPKPLREQRREAEAALVKAGKPVPYPTYERLKAEQAEEPAVLLFTITDEDGEVVRILREPARMGLNRATWDLRYPGLVPTTPAQAAPTASGPSSTFVIPGEYKVSLAMSVGGQVKELVGPVPFKVQGLAAVTLPAADRAELAAFQKKVRRLGHPVTAASSVMRELDTLARHYRASLKSVTVPHRDILDSIKALEAKLEAIQLKMTGDPLLSRLDKDTVPGIQSRIGRIAGEQYRSTSAPTKTQRAAYAIAEEEFKPVYEELKTILAGDVKAIEKRLDAVGAPYTPGRLPDWK